MRTLHRLALGFGSFCEVVASQLAFALRSCLGVALLCLVGCGEPPIPPSTGTRSAAGTSEDETVWLEAEYPLTQSGPWQVGSSDSASGRTFLSVPQGSSGAAAQATYRFDVEHEGWYSIAGRTIAPTGRDNSFHIRVDDQREVTWSVAISTEWQWGLVNDWTPSEGVRDANPRWYLSPGPHTLTVRSREDGAQLDKVLVTGSPNPSPTGVDPSVLGIIGSIDRVVAEPDGDFRVEGWACARQWPERLALHVYAGGPAGTGEFVVNGSTNLARPAGETIGALCKTWSPHHFRLTIPVQVAAPFAEQRIYVHGLSPYRTSNALLNKSGQFRLAGAASNAQRERAVAMLDRVYRLYRQRGGEPIAQLAEVNSRWALATLSLSQITGRIPDHDVALANDRLSRIERMVNSPIPRTEQLSGIDEGNGLYWSLIHIVYLLENAELFNRLTPAARATLQKVLSDFVLSRAKVDEACLQPGCLDQISGSENHDWHELTIFAIGTQHLARHQNPRLFDGARASVHAQRWSRYIKKKIERLASRGIGAEISPLYITFTLAAMYALRDLSSDTSLAHLAERFITLIMADAAKDSINGVRGGGKTRVYADYSQYSGRRETIRDFNHVLVNVPSALDQRTHGVSREALSVALSSYRLPAEVVDLIEHPERRTLADHDSRRIARGINTPDEGWWLYRLLWPSGMRRFSFAHHDFVVGGFAIEEWRDSDEYIEIHGQNQWMGLVTKDTASSRVFFATGQMNGPNRYRGLTGVGRRGAMLVKRQRNHCAELRNNCGDLFAYLSADFGGNLQRPGPTYNYWTFARSRDNSVFVGLKPLDARSGDDYRIVQNGVPGSGTQIYFNTTHQLVAIQAASAAEMTFDAFRSALSQARLELSGGFAHFETLDGHRLELHTNAAGPAHRPRVNGNVFDTQLSRTFSGPHLFNQYYESPTMFVRDTSGRTIPLLIASFESPISAQNTTAALYRFDRVHDGQVADASGGAVLNLQGVVLGAAPYPALERAAYFDGAAIASTPTTLQLGARAKIDVWLRDPTDDPLLSGTVVDLDAAQLRIATGDDHSRRISWQVLSDCGDRYELSLSAVDGWHHVTAEFADGLISLVVIDINGRVVDSGVQQTRCRRLRPGSSRLHVGGNVQGGDRYTGYLDDLRVSF